MWKWPAGRPILACCRVQIGRSEALAGKPFASALTAIGDRDTSPGPVVDALPWRASPGPPSGSHSWSMARLPAGPFSS